MSTPHTAIHCPVCRAELSLEAITRTLDDELVFARLVAMSVPMANLVTTYTCFFTPEKQALTLRKKLRIIQQLLPDLHRQAITHKGRDWPAPLPVWAQAIETMVSARAAGKLELPLSGHGYLYAVIAGISNKSEAVQEQAALDAARHRAPAAPVTVAGPQSAATALAKDPALAALDAAAKAATPMPDSVRAKLAALRGKATPTPATTPKE